MTRHIQHRQLCCVPLLFYLFICELYYLCICRNLLSCCCAHVSNVVHTGDKVLVCNLCIESVMLLCAGDFPVVQDNLWLGQDVSASVATSLVPKLQKTKTSVEELLYQVATLEVALQAGTNAVTLANLMPKHWADFIRNSPLEEVRPIGTTPMRI